MSLPSLAVKVMGYEEQVDIEESTTNKTSTVTVYVTKVDATIDPKIKAVYFLRKRYSDYSTLFAALKDRIPNVENYKFPNKSIFNTTAQFTKDRRLGGFNDLLKLLVAMRPTPMEFGEFLEFGHHLGENAIHFTSVVRADNSMRSSSNDKKNLSMPQNQRVDTPQGSSGAPSSAGKLRAQMASDDTRESFSLPPQGHDLGNPLLPTDEKSVNGKMSSGNVAVRGGSDSTQEQMLKILKQTFLMTLFFYFCCVMLGVVNIKKSSLTEITFTIIAIASFLSLLRMGNMKNKMKNS